MGAALVLATCLGLGYMPWPGSMPMGGCLGLGCCMPWPWLLHAHGGLLWPWPWQHAHGLPWPWLRAYRGLPRPWRLHALALATACPWGVTLALAACLTLVTCPWGAA